MSQCIDQILFISDFSPRLLATALKAKGYNGTYLDSKTDLLASGHFVTLESLNAHIQSCQSELDWSSKATLYSTKYGCLPPSLRLLPSNESEPIIHLIPAHPSNLYRHNFIAHFSQISPNFVMISRLFWIWAQSWGFRELTPCLCAFMVIYIIVVSMFRPSEYVRP